MLRSLIDLVLNMSPLKSKAAAGLFHHKQIDIPSQLIAITCRVMMRSVSISGSSDKVAGRAPRIGPGQT